MKKIEILFLPSWKESCYFKGQRETLAKVQFVVNETNFGRFADLSEEHLSVIISFQNFDFLFNTQ